VKHLDLKPYLNYSFHLIQSSDFENLARFRKDPHIMRALDKEIENDGQIQHLLSLMHPDAGPTNSMWWFIYSNNILIGNFGLKLDSRNARAEIGYVLFKQFWRQKHMSVCLPVLLDYAFNHLNYHSLEARINPINVGSKKLLLANGFVLEGYFKEDYCYKNEFLDTEVYSLLKQNYVPRETLLQI